MYLKFIGDRILKTTKLALAVIGGLMTFGSSAGVIDFNSNPDVSDRDIYIYGMAHGGTGCPADSVSAVMAADHQTISVFFDEYLADSSASSRGRDRKTCNIGLSVKVPHGLSVALIEMDYRGFVDVPPGGYASLDASYFFAGQTVGRNYHREWGSANEPVVQDFVEDDSFNVGAIVWSPCGTDAILRANTSIRANKPRSGDGDTFIQVDTIDISSGMVYQLQWAECTE